MDSGKITVVISLTVDPAVFDLGQYTEEAVSQGWDNLPENGVWMLAEEIANEHSTNGCQLTVEP